MGKNLVKVILLGLISTQLCGCWLVAAGAGAEAAYVATQDNRSATETMSDQTITASIKTKLLAHPDVSGLDINVDTFKGNVSLKGFVHSENEAVEAVRLAREVGGVKTVTSKLVVG